jgi:hypothetical protein
VTDARITLGVETAAGKVEPEYATFSSGSKFRLRFQVTAELYLYSFRRQAGGGWQVLQPEQKIEPNKEMAWPAGADRYEFPSGEGHEQFALALAPVPLPELARLAGVVQADELEKRFAAVERGLRPNGIRRYEESGGLTTVFFGPVKKIALVLRVPLFHRQR